MEDIDNMGVKQLKEYIQSRGGDYSDCVEKTDLKKRALLLKGTSSSSSTTTNKPPASTTTSSLKVTSPVKPAQDMKKSINKEEEEEEYEDVDEDIEVSDSDDEQQQQQQQNNSPLVTDKAGKQPKRFSVFRVKKFVTSKMGETRAGQATVMKVLGEEGDTVVQSIKSVTKKLTDSKTAKENKKDGIRLCLKAFNIWKHKDFKQEDILKSQTDVQLLAEIFCRECTNVTAKKTLNLESLLRVSKRVQEASMKMMSPHLQPKNAARLLELLNFYTSNEFFEALFTRKDCEQERLEIEQCIQNVLLPLHSILSGERERSSLVRNQQMLRMLENKRFDAILDYPQVAQMFQGYLDLEVGLSSKNALRFLLAVRDFEKTSSRPILKVRAPKIVERFLTPSAEFHVDGVSQEAIDHTLSLISSGSIGMGTFSKAGDEVRKTLEDDYINQFVTTQDFLDLLKKIAQDCANLEKQLLEEGSLSPTPINQGRRTFYS